ncbi:MAG: hypothetical protein NDI94_06255 [Candidatus Woesearchaeota archaeon]|nr:hypothetical protein [Candidatus Woesearchaeota archaeon]
MADELVLICRDDYSMMQAMEAADILHGWGYGIRFLDPSAFRSKSDPHASSFLDYELLANMPLKTLEELRGRESYIIHHTRVYDTTLMDIVTHLDKEVSQFKEEIKKMPARFSRKLLAHYSTIESIVSEILGLASPEGLLPAKAGMMGAHPSFLLDQLYDTVEKLSFVGAVPILVQTKSTDEWSHKAPFYLEDKKQHEAFLLKYMMSNFVMHGLRAWSLIHPHAEDESLYLAKNLGLPLYVGQNPQNGLHFNGISIDNSSMFPQSILEDPRFNPFGAELQNYSPDTTLIMSSDAGALPTVYGFVTQRVEGYRMCASKGHRKVEGQKEFLGELSLKEARALGHDLSPQFYLDNIDAFLDTLKLQGRMDERVTLIILDDKNNTMNTASGDALYKKNRIKEYNNLHGTNFEADVELWVTHMRTPDLGIVKRQLDKGTIARVVCLDTVRYEPTLAEQLHKYGIENKVKVIDAAAYLSACSIHAIHSLNTGTYIDERINASIAERENVNAPLLTSPFLSPSYAKWGR